MDTQRFIVTTKSNRCYENAYLAGSAESDVSNIMRTIQKDKHGSTSWYMETPTGDATFYTVIRNSEIESVAVVVQKPVPEQS